jgi:hypothetical protein
VDFRLCDEFDGGFGWIADEAMTRTSHALSAGGEIWLIDPLDWPEAIERAGALGKPAGIIQLLDRHGRDCAELAERFGVPLLVAPDDVPGSPFELLPVLRRSRWRESALWWPERRTLVTADALGTNPFFTGGKGAVGVHPLLRLTPPRRLAGLAPEHLLVGHGEGVHGPCAADAVEEALATSRRGLPRVLIRLPFAGR